MVEYRRYLLLAFIVFGLSVGIGVLSSIYNESFVRLILGDDYVNMTLDNIANGNPVAVYKSGSNWGSFLGITFNNLGVSLKAFIYGITAGLGTVYIALSNGVMLGPSSICLFGKACFGIVSEVFGFTDQWRYSQS
ncbi:MAG: membrane protein [Candidatus Parvibacillus calidus]|nr:MAG: membrane protein [Candidatus Parvibacillus calidus]